MGLMSMMFVLGVCARRRQVGDRGSDGDGASSNSPLKLGGGKIRGSRKTGEVSDNESRGTEQVNENGSRKTGAKTHGSRKTEEPLNTINLQQQQQHQFQLRSPVWQHTILMGERCKRPTFSGLILYDEKGNPLPLRGPCPIAPPRHN